MDEDEKEELLNKHLSQLLEFFDTVRIFVQWTENDGQGPAIIGGNKGGGNFYASYGQIREWLIEEDHRTRINVEKRDDESSMEDDD